MGFSTCNDAFRRVTSRSASSAYYMPKKALRLLPENKPFRDLPPMPLNFIFAGAARATGLGRIAVGRGTSAAARTARLEAAETQTQLAAIVRSLGKVKVSSDFPDLTRELKRRYGKKAGGAIALSTSRAMNSGIRPAKTVAKREIARKRNLSAKRADAGLEIVFSTPDRQEVQIRARGRMIPLTRLKGGLSNPKQQSLGVKVTATRGRRALVKGAFLANGRSGWQVFQRARIGGGPKREGRLPIQALTNPSIPHTLPIPEVTDPTIERYNGAYSNAFDKQLSAAIRRTNSKVKG